MFRLIPFSGVRLACQYSCARRLIPFPGVRLACHYSSVRTCQGRNQAITFLAPGTVSINRLSTEGVRPMFMLADPHIIL
jgi:hypothetical protein